MKSCLVLLMISLVFASCKTAEQTSDSEVKIIFGTNDSTERFRSVVLIVHRPSGFHCTGTVVSKNVVLGAAHCMAGDTDPASYEVFDQANNEPAKIKAREIVGVRPKSLILSNKLVEIISEPKKAPRFKTYIQNNKELDMAALVFEPGTFSNFIPLLKRAPLKTDEGYIVGFGRTGFYASPEDVHLAGVRRYAKVHVPRISSKSMFVVRSQLSHDPKMRRAGAAYGDSGGPFLISDPEDGDKLYLAGTLWGTPSGLDNKGRFDTVYLNVQSKEYRGEFLVKVQAAGGTIE